jgi:multiple sugar transport system substrate-binding protein
MPGGFVAKIFNLSRLAVLGALGVFFLAVISCSSPEPVTITVLGEDSSNLQAMKNAKSAFESRSHIKVDFKAHSFEDALQKANEDFAHKAGKYDIILQYNFALSSFVRNRYVYTLDEIKSLVPQGAQEELEKDIFPAAWQEVGFYYKNALNPQAGTVAVGYPFAANTMLLVYNKSMFEDPENQRAYRLAFNRDLKPPATWEEFRQLAKFFTSPKKTSYGVCLQGGSASWLYYEWSNFLFGMGGTMMQKTRGWEGNDTTNVLLDSPSGLEAARFYVSLKPFNAGDFFSTGAPEQREIMLGGKTAMAIMWSDYVYELVERGKQKGLRFGFSPIPGEKSMLAGGAFYINRNSKHPREAAEYVMYLMDKKIQVELMKHGLCSAVMSAYEDPDIKSLDYAEALKLSLARGVYMAEAGPESNEIQAIVTEHLQRVWRGDESVEVALPIARKEIESKRAEIWASLRR